MSVRFRNFSGERSFAGDFLGVKDFLLRVNSKSIISPNFLFGRWEWAFSLPFLDEENLKKIGIWEEDGRIIGLVTYESSMGDAYFVVDPEHEYIKLDMLRYAEKNLSKDGKLRAVINSGDMNFMKVARGEKFRPSTGREDIAVLEISYSDLSYTLPDGYEVVSLSEDRDLSKYHSVLWKGFDHGDNPVFDNENRIERERELSGPSVNLEYNLAVRSPDGEFVSYAGFWHEPGTDYALLEPCATIPSHRKMGMGRAVILEGCRRFAKMGVKKLYVGSGQQFYYSIGFMPLAPDYFWVKEE